MGVSLIVFRQSFGLSGLCTNLRESRPVHIQSKRSLHQYRARLATPVLRPAVIQKQNGQSFGRVTDPVAEENDMNTKKGDGTTSWQEHEGTDFFSGCWLEPGASPRQRKTGRPSFFKPVSLFLTSSASTELVS